MVVKIRNNMCKMSHIELSREKLKNQNKKSGIGGKKERQMRYEFCVNMAQLSPTRKVKLEARECFQFINPFNNT